MEVARIVLRVFVFGFIWVPLHAEDNVDNEEPDGNDVNMDNNQAGNIVRDGQPLGEVLNDGNQGIQPIDEDNNQAIDQFINEINQAIDEADNGNQAVNELDHDIGNDAGDEAESSSDESGEIHSEAMESFYTNDSSSEEDNAHDTATMETGFYDQHITTSISISNESNWGESSAEEEHYQNHYFLDDMDVNYQDSEKEEDKFVRLKNQTGFPCDGGLPDIGLEDRRHSISIPRDFLLNRETIIRNAKSLDDLNPSAPVIFLSNHGIFGI